MKKLFTSKSQDREMTEPVDGKKCAEHESISLFENGKLKSCSKPN